MISIDTNVLLRYLLDDDKVQSKKASKVINGAERILVTDIVLVEAIWTLKGKKYQLDKEGIIHLINALFEEPNIIFEDSQTVWRALNDFRKSKPIKVGNKYKTADFSDALIVNKAKYFSAIENEKLNGVYTFDIAAQELNGTKIP